MVKQNATPSKHPESSAGVAAKTDVRKLLTAQITLHQK